MPEPTKPPLPRPVMPPEYQNMRMVRREPPRPFWTPFQWGFGVAIGVVTVFAIPWVLMGVLFFIALAMKK